MAGVVLQCLLPCLPPTSLLCFFSRWPADGSALPFPLSLTVFHKPQLSQQGSTVQRQKPGFN